MKAAAAIGMVLASTASAAAQQPAPRPSLSWTAPSECPGHAQLVAAVEGLLGAPLNEARAQALSVSVAVVGGIGGFSAKVRFEGQSGVTERYLEHPDCQKLMEAAALMTALAIDPDRVNDRRQTQEQAQERADAAAAPFASPARQPASEGPLAITVGTVGPDRADRQLSRVPSDVPRPERKQKPLRPAFEVVGFAGGGALPRFGPGLSARIALRRARFELAVVGSYWLPRTDPVLGLEQASLKLSLVTIGVRPCVWPLLGTWSLRACGGVDWGDLAATGKGLNNERTLHSRFSAATAELSVRYGHWRLAPIAGLEGAWALERPPFGVRLNSIETETFRPARFGIRGFLGLSGEI